MAVGLIKKQIVHSSEKDSPTKFLGNLFAGKGNMRRLASAEKDFKKQMEMYKDFDFKNPYKDNVYSNMQNTMEDLTVNQQQAQFQAQQTQQSQANILSSLQTGGNFNAGNIQALANQGAVSAQRASASIGQQESANRMAQAREASRLQTMERKGRDTVQRGEAMVQGMEFDRQSTMLGMSMQQVGNAQQAIAANKAMWGNIIGGVAAAAISDRRLKENIKLIGQSPSGLNVYSFEYKNKERFGKGVYQGVMSDEIPSIAVVKSKDGYDAVNYNMLDVKFKQI